jgi:hypothetical protein
MATVARHLTGLKLWIAGLTSALVILPALINSGHDVYVSLRDLPRSDTERTNQELFRKYFNKQAVISLPLPIKHSLGTAEASISIYEEGDVLVEYGKRTQWFPFPMPKEASSGFFIGNAFAQENSASHGIGPYRQTERMDGRILVRERSYDNGAVQQQRIDMRTGEISNRTTSSAGAARTARQVAPIGVIDLEAKSSGGSAQATQCSSQAGTCTLVRPAAKGAGCFCLTTHGSVAGRAQ